MADDLNDCIREFERAKLRMAWSVVDSCARWLPRTTVVCVVDVWGRDRDRFVCGGSASSWREKLDTLGREPDEHFRWALAECCESLGSFHDGDPCDLLLDLARRLRALLKEAPEGVDAVIDALARCTEKA